MPRRSGAVTLKLVPDFFDGVFCGVDFGHYDIAAILRQEVSALKPFPDVVNEPVFYGAGDIPICLVAISVPIRDIARLTAKADPFPLGRAPAALLESYLPWS